MVNYFELYDIPVSFHPDTATVKKKFYELSRRYHPDRFTQSDDASQIEALQMAALNNEAYRTLNDSDAVIAYILRINEVLEPEEKYKLPNSFLMEMMDLNEAISDYEMEPDNTQAHNTALQSLNEQLVSWTEGISPLLQQYDQDTPNKDLLLQIKDYYFRKKYLLRIQERINKFATR